MAASGQAALNPKAGAAACGSRQIVAQFADKTYKM
jgi:hypothetical protein